MTLVKEHVEAGRLHGSSLAAVDPEDGAWESPHSRGVEASDAVDAISPVRKAAIVLVSLDQSLASQLLAHLDRPSVEAVTWEIARLDRIDPAEQAGVLDEFSWA